MKSVIYNKYGGPEVLELTEMEDPVLKEDKILVKVKASSVNPVDYKVRRGDLKILTGTKFPKFAGSDFSGVIEEVGEEVAGYKRGDEVYGFINPFRGGAYSEYVIVDPLSISLKADNLSFEESASIPIAALTALQSLTYLGGIKEGESVLINGASGGVGSFAVQIAKGLDAEVAGTCSRSNIEFCKKLGADTVFDYSGEDLEKSGMKFDVLFDVAAKMKFSGGKKFLKEGGAYISTVPGARIFFNGLLNFIPKKKKAKFVSVKSAGIDLAILTGFASGGIMKPHIERVFELKDVKEAHKLAESGKIKGKIVVRVR